MLDGRSILVTGGTGSLGRALVRALLRDHAPERIVVFSRDEEKQVALARDLGDAPVRFVLGDVRDAEALSDAMRGVSLVVHAAALKHVALAERNPLESVKTNIHGAQNMMRAARMAGVERVVSVSTDKAVDPVGLYGACKLAADRIVVEASARENEDGPRASVVRLGNIAGSRGSVVPLYARLIAEGATALPMTDERMTRFWMSGREAAAFTLAAFERMEGGDVLVPKAASARLPDIVEACAGHRRTRTIGMRPGERLHEAMWPSGAGTRVFERDGSFVLPRGAASAEALPEDRTYRSDRDAPFLDVETIVRLNAERE